MPCEPGPEKSFLPEGRAAVAVGQAAGRKDDLPDLGFPGAEGAGAGQQVVAPHPFEFFVVAGR